MRTNKRVVSLALAVIMLFCVMATSASAFENPAFGTGAAVKLTVTSDKAVYKTGDIAKFTVSAQATDKVGKITVGGQYFFGFDNTVLDYSSADFALETSVAAHGVTYGPEFLTSISAGSSQILNSALCEGAGASLDSTVVSWNSQIGFLLCSSGTAAYVNCETPVELFSFNMKVIGATGATAEFGLNGAAFDAYVCFVSDEANGGLYGNSPADFANLDGNGYTSVYSYQNCTISVSNSTAPSVASASTDIKCRWNAGATKLQIGILGTISGAAITANEGVAVELTACGVLATADAAVTADNFKLANTALVNAACGTLYDQGDGTYKFRAVIDNVPHDADTTVYYRTYITLNGVTYYSDIVSTTGAAQYARAIAAGLPAFAG